MLSVLYDQLIERLQLLKIMNASKKLGNTNFIYFIFYAAVLLREIQN